ncbi:MAG TPA: tripartite tricarboxylate transporter substrate binding protein [Burkholderiales bacterium]|nr:tripartite tricarboxylate transporter substrate binding protein [Burkholderiales bacterium]
MRVCLSIRSGAALLAAAFAFAMPAGAASWPEKPVRMIVPFNTGGGTDIQARLLAQKLQELSGQHFIVENRPGASGLIGAQVVVESPPDGYTLLFTTATLAINTTLHAKMLKFDPRADLVPATVVSNAPNVLCVHPSVPARTVPDLIALAKERPGKLNIGVNTTGSTSHLAAEMLKDLADINTVIVPFTGGGPASVALMTGEIDFLFATGPVASAALKTGRVRCLAVTTAERNRSFPDLPTMNEFLPGLVTGNWYAMFFPKGTSADTATRLAVLIRQALDDDQVKAFYAREGLEAVASAPSDLFALLRHDIDKYAGVIRTAGISIE